MRDANTIVRDRQLTIRRQMNDRGISLRAVALNSGIKYETIVSYFPGDRDEPGVPHREPATISGAAFFMLLAGKALPLDLLSLLLPDGLQIMRVPEGLDHDVLCELAADYVAEKNRAHHPDSEAGRELGPNETAALNGKVVRLKAAA
jgi:hypothetical protein